MAQSFAQEGELVQTLKLVDEDFICFSAKGHEFARWANLEVCNLVGVGDLGNWLSLVAVPEEDWAAGARCHQLELVVAPLAHCRVEAILCLAHLCTLLLLQVVGGQRAVRAARMNDVLLSSVREERNDVFLLIYSRRSSKVKLVIVVLSRNRQIFLAVLNMTYR